VLQGVGSFKVCQSKTFEYLPGDMNESYRTAQLGSADFYSESVSSKRSTVMAYDVTTIHEQFCDFSIGKITKLLLNLEFESGSLRSGKRPENSHSFHAKPPGHCTAPRPTNNIVIFPGIYRIEPWKNDNIARGSQALDTN